MEKQSTLLSLRLQYQPQLPDSLRMIDQMSIAVDTLTTYHEAPQWLINYFPHTHDKKILGFRNVKPAEGHVPLKVGVVLSGGQAAGGHNVITGIYDALKKMNSYSVLIGFLDGPSGIIENKWINLDASLIDRYRNTGGFDMIGSGRTKIETSEQFAAAETTVRTHKLDGLIIIGGDDSNTNAAFLAEYFVARQCPTRVIGVPKTIDGDLKNAYIEMSFGFDTATKTYSEIISNIARDAMSAKKSYYFIKMMGRTASHITLECALRTHPNIAFISEEIDEQKYTLNLIVQQICDMICAREAQGKSYGVVLIPEGIIEFIPEMKILVEELNSMLAEGEPHAEIINAMSAAQDKIHYVTSKLSSNSAACLTMLPFVIQTQLLLDRDPHGNVQVSKIETERLLIDLVKQQLKNLHKAGKYKGKFSAQPFFCGYEGRSAYPSNFDSQYCYALGHVAALLIDQRASGYMCCIRKLHLPATKWEAAGIPLTMMMAMERRGGKMRPVISKALVDLQGKAFNQFRAHRGHWITRDDYLFQGPIQFFGPAELTEEVPLTL